MEQESLRRLAIAARRITAERDLDRALAGVLAAAQEITGARQGAVGVLSPDGTEIARHVTLEPDNETSRIVEAASVTPRLQEEMIRMPAPIRRAGVLDEPAAGSGARSSRSFLAVPILLGRRSWGHLYLADAEAGAFSEDDEKAALVLSALTSIAVEHVQLLDHFPAKPEQALREMRRGEAMIAMARVLGRDPRLQEVLEVIAEEGRGFIEARALVVFLPIGDRLEAVSAALAAGTPNGGFALPLDGALSDAVFRGLRTAYLDGKPRPEELGLRRWLGVSSGLLVPVCFVGRAVGVVAAFDRQEGGPGFDADDERLLRSFAGAAATAIVTCQLVQAERAQRHAGEQARERTRLARELHDETLQVLGMLRLTLSGASRGGDPERLANAVESAVAHLDQEIEELRRVIEKLRPAALDALGLERAIRALAEDAATEGDLEVTTDIELGGVEERLSQETEHALYRTVQEALRNVVKHAEARHVHIDLSAGAGDVELRISDDGRGIGERPGRIGFGLLAMRGRIESVGGRFNLTTSEGGTTVLASFPVVQSAAAPADRHRAEPTPPAQLRGLDARS